MHLLMASLLSTDGPGTKRRDRIGERDAIGQKSNTVDGGA